MSSPLTQSAKRGIGAISLPGWVLLGALAGAVAGVVFGERAAILEPVGSAYAMMLQISVYLFMWCLTFAGIWLLALAVPAPPLPSVVTPDTVHGEADILERLIPANLFDALGHNYVPAVVVFAIIYGIAIQKVERKSALFEVLEAIQVASVTIWGWIVRFAPIGVFALFASAAGTIEPARLSGLLLYVGLLLFGTLLLAFVVLPAALVALVPVGHREILKELQPAMTVAVVTTLSVVALPFVQRTAERVATKAGCPEGEERADVIKAVLSLSYVLAQLGNYFVYLLMLYAAYAYKVQLTPIEQLLLPVWTLLSGLGSPSAVVDGVIFLGNWLRLPSDLLNLFLETWTVTRYGQVLLSVMGFAFATILIPLVYFGRVRLRPSRGLSAAAVTIVLFGVVIAGGTVLRPLLLRPTANILPELTLDPALTSKLEVRLYRAPAAAETATTAGNDPTLGAIQSGGVLRVGYNPHVIPFSYWNAKEELVGYDIAFAYRLALDLDVKLELIPFEWQRLSRELIERRFHVAMAGIYETDDRLQTLTVSRSYYQSPVALIVRSERAHEFLDRAQIMAMPDLRLAVFDDPVLVPMVRFLFPKAAVRVVPNYDVLPAIADQVDGAIWTLEQAGSWAATHPGFTAVAPANMGGPILLAYLMPPGADVLRRYLDQWLELKEADGFRTAQLDYWMKGKPRADRPPRWNLLDALMGARH